MRFVLFGVDCGPGIRFAPNRAGAASTRRSGLRSHASQLRAARSIRVRGSIGQSAGGHVEWQSAAQFSTYKCADFQISLKGPRRFLRKTDRIILCRLDLKSVTRFFWAFTVCKSNNAWTAGRAAGRAGDIGCVFHAGSNERATCIGCINKNVHLGTAPTEGKEGRE